MHISITVRDQIFFIVSPCPAHVWITADIICHICSNLIEVDSTGESQACTFSSNVHLVGYVVCVIIPS